MSQSSVVSISGVDYDSHSGLPVGTSAVPIQQELRRVQSVHAKGVHATQQRSATLNRRFVKKTTPVPKQTAQSTAIRPKATSMDVRRPIKRSPHISKYARDPALAGVHKRRVATADIAPKAHPAALKAHARTVKSPVAHSAPTAKDIKHAAMGQALANAKPEQKQAKKPRGRALNVAAASLGVLLITGYFTYVNMPNLSVRVAAAQAGIDASYPEYRPVGYRLNGPVAYQDGKVSMKFASNSGPLAFALNQSNSNWDSSALLEKYVNPQSDGKYATYNDGGLTIYTYGTDAAWVNGGILYTVEGTATLSNEQIRKIATSL